MTALLSNTKDNIRLHRRNGLCMAGCGTAITILAAAPALPEAVLQVISS